LAEILLNKGESLEQALRRFKRQVLREGILQEAKRRTHFLKPSEAKKLKSKMARIRARRQRRFKSPPDPQVS
jgi:small subunit ribosomal protein S21